MLRVAAPGMPPLPCPRRLVAWTLRASAASILLGISAPAAAADKPAPRTSSLSWIRLPGADACVSTQDLARDVEARLRRPVFVSPAQADVSVEGHIEPRAPGPGWKATIALRDAKGADGASAYSAATALALMAFFVIACQCMSTLAAVRRETRSWRWPLFLFAYTYGAAWILSVVVFQVARAAGL